MKIFKRIVFILLICIISVPLIGIAVATAGCGMKMSGLDRQASDIQKKFERTSLPVSDSLKVRVNGDCLTGSGTSFIFTLNNPQGSPRSIVQQVTNEFERVDIPVPRDINTPKYLFGQDGSVSGGDTPIRQLYVTYGLSNGFDSYSFLFQLPKTIPCSYVGTTAAVECEGVKKDELLKHLLETAEVTSVKVEGDVRKP